MSYLIISLLLLGVLVAFWHLFSGHKDEDSPVVQSDGCATCNGDNDRCEQECMLEAAVKPVEYFDDEELDRFKGRPSDSYTDEETDQFEYILNTMRPEEVSAWRRSLSLRGIEVPDQLKSELMILLED